MPVECERLTFLDVTQKCGIQGIKVTKQIWEETFWHET